MEQILEILKELGIAAGPLVVNVLAFLLVMYLLAKFFFRPFGQFLADRAAHIKAQMSEAEAAREQAQHDLQAMAERHKQMQEDLAREAEKQRQAARDEAKQIMDEANRLANERKRHAEEQLARDVAAARQELRAQTAGLATDIARRALDRALGPDERQQSVETALRYVEQLAEQENNAKEN
jgi:F-type H+-transporting ATPase subunit b